SVCFTVISFRFIPGNLIMNFTSIFSSRLKANTDLRSFKRIDTHDCTGELCIELMIIMYIRSNPSWYTFYIDFRNATDGVTFFFRLINCLQHFLFNICIECSNRRLLGDHLSFFYRKRSEEHTSELQSRFDLVCRLLLEKKKQ